MSKSTCCKDCTKREAGCHAKCPEYMREYEATKEQREKRLWETELRCSVSDAQWNGYRRINVNKWRRKRK